MRGPIRAGIAMLAGLAGLAVAAPALAATTQAIAQTGGFTIAGVPLNISIELDPATGDIKSVSVDPNAANATGTDLTAVADSPTKVKFESADGTTTVSVKAKKSSLSVGVRTDSLDKLVGPGTWSTKNLFAAPTDPAAAAGTATAPAAGSTIVKYTVGKDAASGAPTFSFDGDPTGLPAGATATVLGTWNGSAGDDHDDDEMSAGGRMAFEMNGFRKTLTIAVFVHTSDDGTTSASMRVTLQGKDIQRLPLADLAAKVQPWSGQLCDGTKATITYTIDPTTGAVSVTSTDPADAVTNTNRHGVLVKFATGDKVSIQVFTPSSGNASLKIDRKGRECKGTRVTSPDPSVNVPVSTTAPSDRKHGGDKGDKHGTTTTTAAGATTASPAPANAAGTNGGRTGGGHGGHGGGNGGGDGGNG